MTQDLRVEYQTSPDQYRHWKLKFEGPVATLAADFDENGGLRPGYKLKLNSYDLGVAGRPMGGSVPLSAVVRGGDLCV